MKQPNTTGGDAGDGPHRRPPSTEPGGRRFPGRNRALYEFLLTFLVAFALVFGFVRPAIAASYQTPTGSMDPTIKVGDRVMANKFVYDFTGPDRGDVVVFEGVENPGADPLMKRVVGLPGDTIEVRDGALLVNGEPRSEPYVVGEPCVAYSPQTCSFGPVTVPEDHFFAMGDNRAESRDSRFFGAVPEENLVGEVFARFWPPGRLGGL